MRNWMHILVSQGSSLELKIFHYAINAEIALAKEREKNTNAYLITKNIEDWQQFDEIKNES